MRRPIRNIFFGLLRSNLGSIAFGCVLRPSIWILAQIDTQMRSSFTKAERVRTAAGSKTKVDLIFDGFSKFFRSMNRNGYIKLGTYNCSFIESAYMADSYLHKSDLMAKNQLDTGFNTACKIIVAFGQVSIAVAATVAAVFVSLLVRTEENKFSDNAYLFTIFGLISVLISVNFMGTYSIAIDTLSLCFQEDILRNNGTAERPYHMSDRMRALMDTNLEIVKLS